MTTINGREQGTAQARRRRAVRLTMITGSALTLTVSWLGVLHADRTQPGASVVALQPAAAVATIGSGPAVPASDGALLPAPAAPRQVVVVRRSRAS